MHEALLAQVLRDPQQAQALSLRDWEILIWQARAAELLAQLHGALERAGLLDIAPAPARRQLALAARVAQRHQQAVAHELRAVQQTLAPLGVPVLLLKGSAYAAGSLRAGQGRIYNDIDLMVPKAAIDEVETQLSHAGWIGTHTNAYDQRYYRDWMHEIPPLEHKHRATVLDVHHTILPPTSAWRVDVERLFASAQPAPAPWGFFKTLAPADLVLHSASHLFFGEFHKGLRDLHDLHQLLLEFGEAPGFWPQLQARAEELGLQLPLADALAQCQRLLGTPVPLQMPARSPWPARWRNWLFRHALRSPHPSSKRSGFALWLVFVRSHWLRMPLGLLVYHLLHKAILKPS